MSATQLLDSFSNWHDDAPVSDAETESHIHVTKIQSQYQQIPMILTIDLVNAGLVGVVISSHITNIKSFMFFGSIIVLAFGRACAWALYRTRIGCLSDRTWAALATIGSGLSGILWGLGSSLLLPDSLVEQTFLAFLIGVMCAAPLVSFSYYFPAFVAYVVPATLPLASRFFLQGWGVNTAMGDMVVVYAVAIAIAAYNSNRTFTDVLRLNFVLKGRTRELSAANAKLDTEIMQRGIAEDQLRQAQKMEAIGQLTGGIAHDFNNLLTGVIGHLEMACKRVGDDPRTGALLQAALHAADRGATLTRHLLAFARRQHLDPKGVDIKTVIGCMEQILRQTIGPDIRLTVETQPDLAAAWVDPNQLELAILNLALNARDAMPNGGILCIKAENRREECSDANRELSAGDYVTVSVSDTGTGMAKETLSRAFEPFFTTKEAGRGSGLGLSMVQGFGAQSGGIVQITSALGQGTEVDIWLPQAEGSTIEHRDVEEDVPAEDTGDARILVCDDDDDVRAFVVELLRDSNYTVWEADRPSAALRILETVQAIDLLLVDYVLPEMKGPVFIERALACQPGLKSLLMTGYAEALRAGAGDGVPMIAKPFRVADLNKRIREILAIAAPDTNAGQLPPGGCADSQAAHDSPHAPAYSEILSVARV